MLNSKELLAEQDIIKTYVKHIIYLFFIKKGEIINISPKHPGTGLLFTWTQNEQNYGKLASNRLQWIMHAAKNDIGKYGW